MSRHLGTALAWAALTIPATLAGTLVGIILAGALR